MAALLLLSSTAYADAFSPTMRLRIQDLTTGQGVVLSDNGAGDLDPTLGVLFFSGAVGGFGLNFTFGVSQPAIGGTFNQAELALQSTNIHSSTGVNKLLITLEDYGFGPEYGSRTLSAFVSGNMTGAPTDKATFYAYASPSNQVPDLGPDDLPPASALGPLGALPADTVKVWPDGITFGLNSVPNCTVGCSTSFSGQGGTGFLADGEYALFSQLLLELTGSSSLSISALNVTVTPEPATLLLLSTGASAAAWARRRRNKRGYAAIPA